MAPANAFRGWAGIALLAVILPMVLLAIYPGWKTALGLSAVGLFAVGAVSLAVHKSGPSALTSVGLAADRFWQSFGEGKGGSTKPKRVPRPTGYWKGQLIEAVGGQCEIQTCRKIDHLEVHHISEHARGGGNELRNLLVLCANHHKQAGSGGINKSRQRTLAARARRFPEPSFPNKWAKGVVRKSQADDEPDFGF